jgi:hypothetical protein
MTTTETKMQTACVIYNDGHEEAKPMPIPMPPPEKLAAAFETGNCLYLYATESGYVYSWYKTGYVEMDDRTHGIHYEWYTKPTLKEAILTSSHDEYGGSTTIFKTDGTVIRRTRPYPYARPAEVWEFVWPNNPETVLVDGDETMYDTKWYEDDDWDDYVTERDHMTECSKCSSGPKMPGYCEHVYESDEDDEDAHEHPEIGMCRDKDCVPCPGCRGPYDGLDHGGLGCTRYCAWGELMDQCRHDRW